jgi:hypothetical protein
VWYVRKKRWPEEGAAVQVALSEDGGDVTECEKKTYQTPEVEELALGAGTLSGIGYQFPEEGVSGMFS